MFILTTADYDQVRAALGTDVDADLLPDEIVALGIYSGAAELEIAARVPTWASLTGAAADRLLNAAIYMTAALIAPAMPRLRRESFGDYSSSRSENWDERAAQLRAKADAELAYITDPTNAKSAIRPTMFAVAPGLRGS